MHVMLEVSFYFISISVGKARLICNIGSQAEVSQHNVANIENSNKSTGRFRLRTEPAEHNSPNEEVIIQELHQMQNYGAGVMHQNSQDTLSFRNSQNNPPNGIDETTKADFFSNTS